MISFLKELVKVVIFNASGSYGYKWRYRYWKKRLKYLGVDVRIEPNVRFEGAEFITIQDNSWIDRNVVIIAGIKANEIRKHNQLDSSSDPRFKKGHVFIDENCHIAINTVILGLGGVVIGRNTGIASGCYIYSISHHYRNVNDSEDSKQYLFSPQVDKSNQYMIYGPIVISDNCAIGLSSVILPGTNIGKGSWISANSIICGKVDPQTVVTADGKTKDISRLKLE